MRERGHEVPWRQESFFRAMHPALCADLIRPSLPWLITSSLHSSALVGMLAQHRDPTGFARLRERCVTDPSVNTAAATRTAYRAAQILVAKGGIIADIVPGDVLELLDIEAELRGTSIGATHLFYRVLHDLDVFDDQAPATLRELRTGGQRTPEELIDRYGIVCRPVRDENRAISSGAVRNESP